MPPGWTKAVNSKTLMDSFAKVDKLLKDGNKKYKICEDCCEYFSKKDEVLDKKTRMIIDVLENMNCHDYSQEQMARILVGLTQLIQTGTGDLTIINNDQTLSALSWSECCCSPSDQVRLSCPVSSPAVCALES